MRHPAYQLLRISLPRTPLNKSKKKGRSRSSNSPQCATQVAPFVRLSYLVVVKNHVFCCKPSRVGFSSRELPAMSVAPVVTTAL
jgi:hypothetical protein